MVPGIIYLAAQRKVEQGVFGICYCTQIGEIYGCGIQQANAVILNPQAGFFLYMPAPAQGYLIPIGGDLKIVDTSGAATVAVGDMFV